VRLVAPGRWATVWRHALPPGEEPLTLAVLRLRDVASGATHPLVAVGTCLTLGEVGIQGADLCVAFGWSIYYIGGI